MANCPICNKPFKIEEILFAKHRPLTEMGEHIDGADINIEGEGLSDSFILGKWQVDNQYNAEMKKYLYMEDVAVFTEQAVFAVKWGMGCEPGVGKAMGIEDNGMPTAVELCEEDAKEAESRYITNCICPYCHSPLLQGYLKATEKDVCRVALLGGPRAGKTQYMLAAYQNIMAFFTTNYGDMVTNVSADPMSIKVMEYLTQLMKDSEGAIPATPINSKILPVIIEIETPDCNGMLKYLVIYDVPGEAFQSGNEDCLMEYEGLICLSDSLMILADGGTQVFTSMNNKIKNKQGVELQESCQLNISTMITHFCNALNAFGKRNFESVSVLISKFDKEIKDMPELNNNKENYHYVLDPHDYKSHQGCVNKQVIAQVDNEMRAILGLSGHPNTDVMLNTIINTTIPQKLKTVPMIFPVSTYKQDGEEYVRCSEANLNRHRLLEPILYALAMAGIIHFFDGSNLETNRVKYKWFQRRNKGES